DLGGVTPWAEAGIRHQFQGNNGRASASYAAADAGGMMLARGAERGDTMAHVALGLTAPVSKGIRLNLSYTGEYG
uniref:autotransporter domain-containing protein n=24 Tax=Pseudomonadota TaxID=1224 RepID=UPI0013DAA2C1